MSSYYLNKYALSRVYLFKGKFLMKKIGLLFLLGLTLQTQAQNLFINEIVSENQNGEMDDFFQNDDWIEIYNTGSITNLAGYYLSDDPLIPTKWQIPATDAGSTTILPNNHRIFWLDKDPEQGADHVDFSLNFDGETLMLVAPDGVTIIDQITYPQMAVDISYGRTCDGCPNWQYFNNVTFDAPNQELAQPTQFVLINEVMVNNTSYWKDLSNEYEPWFEIFNPNTTQVNLAGYKVSLASGEEWTFPSTDPFRTVILPGEFKIYWCDGEIAEGANHASFVLPSSGVLTLKGPDNSTLDAYSYSATAENASWGRQTDGATTSIQFATPTPGVTNSLVIVSAPTLYINEVLAASVNDIDDNAGQKEDWFEIYNPNSFDVNIGGYYFSDNPENPMKWQVPSFYPDSVTIDAGGWLLFFADEDMGQGVLHSSFRLSNNQEALRFSSPDGISLIDEITWQGLDSDTSLGRQFDGDPTWVLFTGTTPDASNNTGIVSVKEETKVSDISIYPNPTQGVLRISKPSSGELFDLNGTVVMRYTNVSTIDLTVLSSAVYILRTKEGDVYRVVKH